MPNLFKLQESRCTPISLLHLLEGPGQDIRDVNTQLLEVANSLHHQTMNENWNGISRLPFLKFLSFVEWDIVVVAPLNPTIPLPSCMLTYHHKCVANNNGIEFVDGIGSMLSHTIVGVKRGEQWVYTQPWGATMLMVSEGEMRLPICTGWDLLIKKSRIQLQREVQEAQDLNLGDRFGVDYAVECWTAVNEQQLDVCVPVIQKFQSKVESQWQSIYCLLLVVRGKLKMILVISEAGVNSGHNKPLNALHYCECKCYRMVVIEADHHFFLGMGRIDTQEKHMVFNKVF